MMLNMEMLTLLLEKKFDNNQSKMARALGVERTHLNKIFRNNGKGAGANICGAIIKYCKDHKLKLDDYIFLD